MAIINNSSELVINTYASKDIFEALKEQGKLKDNELHLIEGDDKSSYEDLTDLPKINGVTVIGDKQSKDLGLQSETVELTTTEIIELWNEIMNRE